MQNCGFCHYFYSQQGAVTKVRGGRKGVWSSGWGCVTVRKTVFWSKRKMQSNISSLDAPGTGGWVGAQGNIPGSCAAWLLRRSDGHSGMWGATWPAAARSLEVDMVPPPVSRVGRKEGGAKRGVLGQTSTFRACLCVHPHAWPCGLLGAMASASLYRRGIHNFLFTIHSSQLGQTPVT